MPEEKMQLRAAVAQFRQQAMSWEVCDCDLSMFQKGLDLMVYQLRKCVKDAENSMAEGKMQPQTVDDFARMASLVVLAFRWFDGDEPEDKIRDDIKTIALEL